MITCPACGKENEDSAFECKRCRAPLREDLPEEHHAEAAPPPEAPTAESLGEVCRRCETYNEPGVQVCTNCGFQLFADALAAAAPEAAPMDRTPPQPWAPPHDSPPSDATPPDGSSSLSDELSALALSDEEAAEAGMSGARNGHQQAPMDRTPPQPYAAPEPEPVDEEPPARSKVSEVAATAAGVAVGAAAGLAAAARRAPAADPPPPAPPAPARAPAPAPAPAEKACANCGAANPPAAKFCFDCGTPFARKAPEAPKAPPPPPAPIQRIEPVKLKAEPPPSIHVEPELSESTAESAPVAHELAEEPAALDEPLAEEIPAEEPLPEEPVADEPIPEEVPEEVPEELAEPLEEEAPPPFQASLVVEKGAAQGTAFLLGHLENTVGGSGAHVELAEDSFAAPHAATLLFAEDHLVVRDEGSANGVFVKVRDSLALEPGDHFVAGERLFRYDGPHELSRNGEGDTPFLGAPRPQGVVVRVSEVLAGGKTGRTCHRGGPAIAIGRTGCDMNFPADSLLAPRHAEVRLGEDGSATLVDLGAGPSGVFLRVRAQAQQDLQGGDVLLVGDHQLRVEVG
jgi:double zinc ribbon protein